jgi:hypothetical protein
METKPAVIASLIVMPKAMSGVFAAAFVIGAVSNSISFSTSLRLMATSKGTPPSVANRMPIV